MLASLDAMPTRRSTLHTCKWQWLKLSSLAALGVVLAWLALAQKEHGVPPRSAGDRLSPHIEPPLPDAAPNVVAGVSVSAPAPEAASIESIATADGTDSASSSAPEPTAPVSAPRGEAGAAITASNTAPSPSTVNAAGSSAPGRKSLLATLAAPKADKAGRKPKRPANTPITKRPRPREETLDSDVILLEALVSENTKRKRTDAPAKEIQP